MCIIPFWLVDWETACWLLGDCWLAPGKAGWSLGNCWLAPGKTGWPLGRLLLLEALGGCWLAPWKAAGWDELLILLILVIFAAAAWWWKLKADADFLVPSRSRSWELMLIFWCPQIWLETVIRRYEMFENQPVTQSSRHVQDANMADTVQNVNFTLRFLEYMPLKRNFVHFLGYV